MSLQLDGTSGISTTGNVIADGTISAGVLNIGTLSSTNLSASGNITTSGYVSASGNVTGGNILTAGSISATGSLTAGSTTINGDLTVTGNASLAGNIVADKIVNGTTEIAIQTADGNANVTVGGTSNVVVFTTGGMNVAGQVSATGNITGNYIIGNGSQLTGLPAGYANSARNTTGRQRAAPKRAASPRPAPGARTGDRAAATAGNQGSTSALSRNKTI